MQMNIVVIQEGTFTVANATCGDYQDCFGCESDEFAHLYPDAESIAIMMIRRGAFPSIASSIDSIKMEGLFEYEVTRGDDFCFSYWCDVHGGPVGPTLTIETTETAGKVIVEVFSDGATLFRQECSKVAFDKVFPDAYSLAKRVMNNEYVAHLAHLIFQVVITGHFSARFNGHPMFGFDAWLKK